MNRRIVLFILLVGFVGWFAIYSNRPTQPKQFRDFGKADIEVEIQKAIMLKEVDLTQETEGTYVGTGIGNDGTKFKLKVTREENKLTWESEDDKGAKVIGSKRWSSTQ